MLNALHMVSTSSLPLNVLGAMRLPVKPLDWDAVELGKSVFLHHGVPDGWWREHKVLAKSHFTPVIFLARSSLASFTWTELTRWFDPIGADRWSVELALKYGMRDGLTYGVGGRWIIVFLVAQGAVASPDTARPHFDCRRGWFCGASPRAVGWCGHR